MRPPAAEPNLGRPCVNDLVTGCGREQGGGAAAEGRGGTHTGMSPQPEAGACQIRGELFPFLG